MTTHICDLTPSGDDPDSARALLYRRGLPEDVIDGVLALHAQELAAVLRREAAVWGIDTAAGKHFLAAADLIDQTRTTPAAASPPPATDRAALRAAVIDALYDARRAGLGGMSEAAAVAHMADAVLAVLPTDGAPGLPDADRQFLTFALDLAADQMASRGDEFEPEDEDAMERLRRLADGERDEQQTQGGDEPAAAIASCPGRELSPNPCRCPCYGCKHHCGVHDPSTVAASTPRANENDGTVAEARPRCHMPHDLTPDSMGVRVCVSIRERIAEAGRRHAEGDHGGCAAVDCETARARLDEARLADTRDAAAPATEQPPADTREETREVRAVPCNYWAYTRTGHTPHNWVPQPGMDPVHCPGYPQEG